MRMVIVLFSIILVSSSCKIYKADTNQQFLLDVDSHLGEKIRKSRIQKGITQEELARAINMSQNSLSLIEDGLATPIHFKIKVIEEILDIKLNED